MQVIWMVRWPQIARKLAWWLALAGYDPRDHSLSQKIYLVYVSIFFSGWFLAVFSLFARPALALLQVLGDPPLDQAAVALFTLLLLAWGFYKLWQATRCSPLVFSEEDACLICQAPVPRGPLALAWLAGDWFEPAAFFWVGAFVLSIALVDGQLDNQTTFADIPAYITSGFRALFLVAFVQLGMAAFVWAAGTLRLHQDRHLRWQPGAVRLAILAVALGLAYGLVREGLVLFNQPVWKVVLWPVYFPLQATFGASPLVPGLLVALLWAGLGLGALALAAVDLNLGRAAQETSQKEMIETALRYGQSELAAHITLTGRLGGGHSPSRLPARHGPWIMGWKDILQSSRSLTLTEIFGWLGLIATGLGACLSPEPGSRGLALAFWAVMDGQQVNARLQKDLGRWGLMHLLPFSSRRLLVAELVLPWMLVVLLGWFTLAIAGGSSLGISPVSAALLLLCSSASVSFASAYDLLGQAKPEMLLNGNAPQVSSAGGLLSIFCVTLTLGLWFWLGRFNFDGTVPAMALAVLLALYFWWLAGRRLQRLD